jgi:uncharacterized membrane protein YfcA/uncharacterized membrane protein YedE/YeeE
MIALGLGLSLLMGATLGLLGGGGSILAVPILVYVFGMDAKAALATSLLVVAVSSALGATQHARRGNVWPRAALTFGGVAMIGAYGGARLAAFVPSHVLLLLFAGLLAATATVMLRNAAPGRRTPEAPPSTFPKLAAEGLGVGMLTGLLGAGGGFLIVPVLTTLGGLPMHAAVGTSLLVIALNAGTALLGYLAHVSLDGRIAALVTVAAVIGSLLGGSVAARLPAATLRRAFAGLVLAMGVAIVANETGALALVAPHAGALAGGVLIGLAAAALLLLDGKIAGISGIVGGLAQPNRGDVGWRAAFLLGLLAGGAGLLAWRPEALGPPAAAPTLTFVLAGLLVGAGTRLGNGCTSGHGVCGVGRGSVRSLVATATFMTTGAATVFLVRHVLGGLP